MLDKKGRTPETLQVESRGGVRVRVQDKYGLQLNSPATWKKERHLLHAGRTSPTHKPIV